MSLTICLITRGRQEYLSQALESYEKFIDTGNVSVILVDNGSDYLSQQILLDWKSKYSNGYQFHVGDNFWNSKYGYRYSRISY